MLQSKANKRVAISTRIFGPEPSAASFRLEALANAFAHRGYNVSVLTVRAPRSAAFDEARPRLDIRRFPVLRDRSGYVRGYLQYMSFDIPLFLRILFGHKRDVIVVEPPPTTGFTVRIAAKLRRTPYVFYGADIWSDAAEATGAPKAVVSFVRWLEVSAYRGAATVLSVNDGVTDRILELAPQATVRTIGNGVDTSLFRPNHGVERLANTFVYTGTASEWQGADVFVRAAALLSGRGKHVRVTFIGQGSAWGDLRVLSKQLNAPVEFIDAVPPEEAANWLRGATASLASIIPESGYDFAFPTKLFASWATGTPAIFAGSAASPAAQTIGENSVLGTAVAHSADAVAEAMIRLQEVGLESRERIAAWAEENVSLTGVAERAAEAAIAATGRSASDGECDRSND